MAGGILFHVQGCDDMKRAYWPLLMLFAMLALLLMNVYWSNAPTEDASRFKAEYELLNKQQIKWQPEFNYREIFVDKNNPIVYATTSQIAEQSLSGESFVLYMGANWCPWCRNAVPALLEAAKSVELDRLYYIDMTDERDVFELKNVVIPFNQPEEKPGLWDISENIIRP